MVGLIMKKKNTFTLRLADVQIEKLTEMAKQERRTVSAIIRNLVDDAEIKKEKTDTKKVKGTSEV